MTTSFYAKFRHCRENIFQQEISSYVFLTFLNNLKKIHIEKFGKFRRKRCAASEVVVVVVYLRRHLGDILPPTFVCFLSGMLCLWSFDFDTD